MDGATALIAAVSGQSRCARRARSRGRRRSRGSSRINRCGTSPTSQAAHPTAGARRATNNHATHARAARCGGGSNRARSVSRGRSPISSGDGTQCAPSSRAVYAPAPQRGGSRSSHQLQRLAAGQPGRSSSSAPSALISSAPSADQAARSTIAAMALIALHSHTLRARVSSSARHALLGHSARTTGAARRRRQQLVSAACLHTFLYAACLATAALYGTAAHWGGSCSPYSQRARH
jgi:hypothetical protein